MDFGIKRTGLDAFSRRAPAPRPVASRSLRTHKDMLNEQIDRFFTCLRAEVAKRAKSRKLLLQIERNTRLSLTGAELRAMLFRKVMRAAFLRSERRLGRAPPAIADRAGGAAHRVDLESFRDSMEHFETAGQDALSEEAAEHLWRRFDRGNYMALIDHLFPLPEKATTDAVPVNSNGFVERAAVRKYEAKVEACLAEGRVEDGPFDRAGNGAREVTLDPTELPDRITYPASRTAVQPPTNWDVREATRSAQLPDSALELEHVHGFNGTPNGSSLFYTADEQLVYYVAAVGIVYNPESHEQRFFQRHTDDICSFAVNNSRTLAATGQLGREPVVHVWRCSGARVGEPVYELARGYYRLQIAALCFSRDDAHMVIVGADHHHTLGVWDTATHEVVAEMASHNGTPPQVNDVRWCPVPLDDDGDEDSGRGGGGKARGQRTSGDRRGGRASGRKCECFVTGGVSNLKFWKFRGAQQPLSCAAARYGSRGRAPRAVTAIAYNHAGRAMTGNDDGRVCLWDGPDCVFSFHAHSGPVHALVASSSHIYSGGEDGMIRYWNLEDLSDPEHTYMCSRERSEVASNFIFSHRPHQPSFKPKAGMGKSNLGNPSAPQPGNSRPPLRSADGAAGRRPQLKSKDIGMDGGSCARGTRPAPVRSIDVLVAGERSGGSSSSVNRTREIIAGTARSTIWRMDGRKGSAPQLLLETHYTSVESVATNPAVASEFATVGMGDKMLYIWDAKTRRPARQIMLASAATACDYKPGGQCIAVGLYNGTVIVLDAKTFKLLISRQDSKESITEVRATAHPVVLPLLLLCLSHTTRHALHYFLVAWPQVRYSPDGYSLAAASKDYTIRIYDCTRGYTPTARCLGHQSSVRALSRRAFQRRLPKIPNKASLTAPPSHAICAGHTLGLVRGLVDASIQLRQLRNYVLDSRQRTSDPFFRRHC
jgi:WD40 repeat protein